MSSRSSVFAVMVTVALGAAALPATASAVALHGPSVQLHVALPKGGGATVGGMAGSGHLTADCQGIPCLPPPPPPPPPPPNPGKGPYPCHCGGPPAPHRAQ
jgi:hypothetical protein